MITFLRGKLAESLPSHISLDVNGVGYEVIVPTSTFDKLGIEGSDVHILTHHHVREAEECLFGFLTREERDLFRLLIGRVSGVGPKMAIKVLGGMTVNQFKTAVINEDVVALAAIKGMGKKTAERIILELKDKVGVVAAWEASGNGDQQDLPPGNAAVGDAMAALLTLGYKQAEAQRAVQTVLKTTGGVTPTTDEFLRLALRLLN